MSHQKQVMGRFFEKIYDKAPGIIAVTMGSDHIFTYANESYKRLIGREDVVGRRVCEVMPELEDQGVLALLDRVFSSGEPFVGARMPMDLKVSDESNVTRRYVSFIYQPVRDKNGEISGLFCEGYDATNEVIATERLLAIQEEFSHAARVNAMGMMAATLAHELNQPLMAISAFASAGFRLMNSGDCNTVQLKTALQSIEEAAQRAGSIIRIMRELTRRGGITRAEFDLKSVIGEGIRLVRAGGCPNSEIVDRVSPELSVYGNRTQILQVVVNLIRNACEAGSQSRPNRVSISAWREATGIVVSVQDSGCGLSAETAHQLFTWSESDKVGGTGLGLAICRTILDGHDGRIWLENSGSEGSDFRFSIPVKQAAQENLIED